MPKKLKIVDGQKIRNSSDVDFCMIGDTISYSYIPKNEIWLEKNYLSEKKFLLDALKEKRTLEKKLGGYAAYKKVVREKRKFNLAPDKVKIKLIKRQGNIKIYLVDGALVRKNFDPFFTLGGHWLVYNYVLKNEVWLDDKVLTDERKHVLIHELYEVNLMKKGKSYDTAHDYAHAAEREARRRDGAIYEDDENC